MVWDVITPHFFFFIGESPYRDLIHQGNRKDANCCPVLKGRDCCACPSGAYCVDKVLCYCNDLITAILHIHRVKEPRCSSRIYPPLSLENFPAPPPEIFCIVIPHVFNQLFCSVGMTAINIYEFQRPKKSLNIMNFKSSFSSSQCFSSSA